MVKILGTALDRDFRNDTNDNFTEHETDIQTVNNRVDNIVQNAGSSNTEIVDARQPATGSPFTTLKARLDANDIQIGNLSKRIPRVSLTDYGAKANANYYNSADGKWYEDQSYTKLANDDTQAIKDALTYLSGFGNGSMYRRPALEFPSGNILVTSPIIIDNISFVVWVGQGIDSTTLIYTGTGDMISLGTLQDPVTNYWQGQASGFRMTDITLRYYAKDNMASNGTRTVNGIVDNGSGGVFLSNVRVKGFKYGFFGKMGSDFSKITDSNFFNCDIGTYLGAGSQQVQLTNVSYSLCNEGLVMERAGQGKIDNCWFMDNYKCDISIESNTNLRTGLPTLSGTSNDLSWTISDCWFETGSGWNTGADHQYHILIKGDTNNGTPKGIKIVKPLLYSGTSGMGTKDAAKKYSFMRVEAGTNHEIEDLLIIGSRVDVAVDTPSGYYPKITQYNTRTSDGYTQVPLWAYNGAGMVSYDFSRQVITAASGSCFIELDNITTGQNLQVLNNGDNTVSFKMYDGTAWRERFKVDVINGRIYMSGTLNSISFASAIPTSGSYVAGDEVLNRGTVSVLGTAGNQYTLRGWKRLTTGSNHVLGTDWVEMRSPTGT